MLMEAEMSGRRPTGRLMFGRMNDVKQALGIRDISVEVARERAMDNRQ